MNRYKLKVIKRLILGLPKSLYFNISYFGLEGFKFPILLSNKVILSRLSGTVKLNDNLKFGAIKLGFPPSEIFDDSGLKFIWVNRGNVSFSKGTSIRNGCVIRNFGDLTFGKNFQVSSPSKFICYKKIEFGDDCLIGWDCQFADGDAHKIIDIDTNEITNPNKPIFIGNHVWFGANVKVYKGVSISDNNVIAANTVLTHSFSEKQCVIGGTPNRILKRSVIWKI